MMQKPSKELVECNNLAVFSTSELQVLLYAVSKIGDTEKFLKHGSIEELKREHILKASDFCELFATDSKDSYAILASVCSKLMSTVLTIAEPTLNKVTEIKFCSMVEYDRGKENILIQFNKEIMPYLARASHSTMLSTKIKGISDLKNRDYVRLSGLIENIEQVPSHKVLCNQKLV